MASTIRKLFGSSEERNPEVTSQERSETLSQQEQQPHLQGQEPYSQGEQQQPHFQGQEPFSQGGQQQQIPTSASGLSGTPEWQQRQSSGTSSLGKGRQEQTGWEQEQQRPTSGISSLGQGRQEQTGWEQEQQRPTSGISSLGQGRQEQTGWEREQQRPTSGTSSGWQQSSQLQQGSQEGIPETMHAVIFRNYGFDNAELTNLCRVAQPQANEVLVKVHAASVNPMDWMILEGRFQEILPLQLPAKLGTDFSGEIVQCGQGCSGRLSQGDEVFGSAGPLHFGAFAEYIVVPEVCLVKKPSGVTFEEAAAAPIAGLNAVQALGSSALAERVQGQKVLILGAGGGNGSFAVQWAAHVLGMEVYGTCSGEKCEFVRQLGATSVVDYKQENWWDTLSNEYFDVVYDCVGEDDVWEKAKRVLKTPQGRFVTLVGIDMSQKVEADVLKQFSHSMIWQRFRSQLLTEPKYQYQIVDHSNNADLQEVAWALEQGKVKIEVSRQFDLPQFQEMLQESKKLQSLGKMVLRVSGLPELQTQQPQQGQTQEEGWRPPVGLQGEQQQQQSQPMEGIQQEQQPQISQTGQSTHIQAPGDVKEQVMQEIAGILSKGPVIIGAEGQQGQQQQPSQFGQEEREYGRKPELQRQQEIDLGEEQQQPGLMGKIKESVTGRPSEERFQGQQQQPQLSQGYQESGSGLSERERQPYSEEQHRMREQETRPGVLGTGPTGTGVLGTGFGTSVTGEAPSRTSEILGTGERPERFHEQEQPSSEQQQQTAFQHQPHGSQTGFGQEQEQPYYQREQEQQRPGVLGQMKESLTGRPSSERYQSQQQPEYGQQQSSQGYPESSGLSGQERSYHEQQELQGEQRQQPGFLGQIKETLTGRPSSERTGESSYPIHEQQQLPSSSQGYQGTSGTSGQEQQPYYEEQQGERGSSQQGLQPGVLGTGPTGTGILGTGVGTSVTGEAPSRTSEMLGTGQSYDEQQMQGRGPYELQREGLGLGTQSEAYQQPQQSSGFSRSEEQQPQFQQQSGQGSSDIMQQSSLREQQPQVQQQPSSGSQSWRARQEPQPMQVRTAASGLGSQQQQQPTSAQQKLASRGESSQASGPDIVQQGRVSGRQSGSGYH